VSLRPVAKRDVALAVLACAALALDIVFASPPHEVNAATIVGIAIGIVPLVALVWRPRLGEYLLAIALVCWVASTALRVEAPDDFVVMAAIFTVGSQRPRRRLAEWLVVAVAFSAVAEFIKSRPLSPAEVALDVAAYALGLTAVGFVGRSVGSRRAYVQTLVDRTENLERERQLLESERDELAREAVATERARIARELHDVVAHHVSVMVIQAGAAEASLPPAAKASAQAIVAIRETGREALAEMRRLLGLLRSEAALDGSEEEASTTAARAPQPGTADIASLAERTREAGVAVTTEIVGTAHRLPAGVDLSVYRVVQEALTNTLRHSGPGAHAWLTLRYEPDLLTVEVRDDGRGKPAVGSVERARPTVGHGLLGMRERVTVFGGRLEAGALAGGGYRVLACFPLEAPIAGVEDGEA
jgi:signal transduction histidine kinase